MPRLSPLLIFLLPPICVGQISGSFSLDKSSYAPGEPVFLSFTLRNDGLQAENIEAADPYTFCSGYHIQITRDGAPQGGCSQSFGGSCVSSGISLAPGASRTERLLLNYQNTSQGDHDQPTAKPGSYTVDASRTISHSPSSHPVNPGLAPQDEVQQVFRLIVDDSLQLSPAVYQPYVEQLRSKDDQVRLEAARTLATLAPAALEPLLLTFATSEDPQLHRFAPLALANLATKTSLAALAEMLLHSEPGTYEGMTVAQKLGETHDPQWFPLLLALADQHGLTYLANAAEAGGDTAIPALLARLRTPKNGARSSVISAFGRTGSRGAVPVLMALLTVPGDESDAMQADWALSQLTHVSSRTGSDDKPATNLQSRWLSWWRSSGSTAPIYEPGECGTETLLP